MRNPISTHASCSLAHPHPHLFPLIHLYADIAQVSIEQAQSRHGNSKGARFTAAFFALDCYAHVLSDELPAHLLATPFDVVSLQFCMHYAFESEVKARIMLSNVATWLRPGGVFIGTVPDAKQLMCVFLPADSRVTEYGTDSIASINTQGSARLAPPQRGGAVVGEQRVQNPV